MKAFIVYLYHRIRYWRYRAPICSDCGFYVAMSEGGICEGCAAYESHCWPY